VLKQISTQAALQALERSHRIFTVHEQVLECNALHMMILEEAITRRANHLIDLTCFISMEVVYGCIVADALAYIDKKEEERIAAVRVRIEQRRMHQDLLLFVEFDIISRWVDYN